MLVWHPAGVGPILALGPVGAVPGWATPVEAGVPSDPVSVGPVQATLPALGHGYSPTARSPGYPRCSEKFNIEKLPRELADLPGVTIRRGDYHQPAPGYSFSVDRDVLVYLVVDGRGEPGLDESWEKTDLMLQWSGYSDSVYLRSFEAGRVTVPARDSEHGPDAYPLPNMCFVDAASSESGEPLIGDVPEDLMGRVWRPAVKTEQRPAADVTFTLEIDAWGQRAMDRVSDDSHAEQWICVSCV